MDKINIRIQKLNEDFSKSRGKENKSAFARKCGLEQSTMAGYLSGKSVPNIDNSIKIAKGMGVSIEWLLAGTGPMYRGEGELSNVSPGPPILKKIPVISWVKAGDWAEAVDPFKPGYADDWINTTATSNINAFALVVHGDSMEPEFRAGDIITVDPGRAYTSGSYVIVKNGNEATFKQLIIDGENVYLKPLNERYPIKDMTGIEFRIVGVVVEKMKRY